MSNAMTQGVVVRRTTLAVALFGVFGYVAPSSAINLDIAGYYDMGQSQMTNSKIRVHDGGILLGDGASLSGSAPDVLLVESGGTAVLENVTFSNNLDHPTGTNGRTARAVGDGSTLSLTNSTINIRAYSTNPETDYNHAFTAGIGANNGGHVEIQGGSITAEGSKRTLGMQANDGGSITATDLEITTNHHFGHGVQAYRSPTGSEIATHIELQNVKITTLGANYSLGVQVANKGASVTATDTVIVTEGTSSAGVEVFNGGDVHLINGSIETRNDAAAGLRVYGGALGSGNATAEGTSIRTSGLYASGILAGDFVEPTSGVVSLNNIDVLTTGKHASGIEAAYGSQITSTQSVLRTQGERAHGVYVHVGGSAELTGDSIETGGLHAYGMSATGAGATITATDTTVTTNGIRGYGAYAEAGGSIDLNGGAVTTANPTGQGTQDGGGSRAYALYATGTGSTITSEGGTEITTLGQRAYGAYAEHGAHIVLNDANVTTHGFMAYGLYADWEHSTIDANNVDIVTTGQVGDGVWAWSGVVNLNGGTVTIGGEPNANWPHETANGLVAVGGTDLEAGGTINATGTKILTRGSNSAGLVAGARNGTVPVAGTVNLTDASVEVLGEESVAARVGYGGTLNSIDSTLRSEQGHGLVLTDSVTVDLDGTSLEAAGASMVSNLSAAGQVQNVSIGAGSTLTVNNGTLLQVNRSSDGMDGIINLTLKAGSESRGDIVDLDGLTTEDDTRAGTTNFIVESDAKWVGVVHGINDVDAEDGSTIVDNGGAPITGNVTAGQNSTLVFNNGASISGGLSTGTGTQASFNGPTTIGTNVVGTGSTFSFGGSTNIGGSVSADSTTFSFSTSAPTVIDGDLNLNQGSRVSGGSPTNPFTVEGDANVNSGSVLGGNLIVRGALGGSGGTLSPGNSIGTQTYATSASFGGTYEAEVNSAGLSDLVIIQSGNFDLSGIDLTVRQEDGTGGYLLNHAYTIVRTEAGDIENEFSSAALDASFANARVRLNPVLYGQDNVKIILSVNQAAINSTAWTSNQQAAYRGLISAGSGNPLAFSVLAAPDMADALDQLSGEVHGSTQSSLLNASGLTTRTLSKRLRDGMGAGAPGYPLWAEVVGQWSTLDAEGSAAKAKTRTGGLFIGGDTEVAHGWRIGGALGFTDSQIKVDDRSSKSDVTSYTAAMYGGKSWPAAHGQVNLLGGVAYTHHDIDSRRDVTVAGNETLKADYKANAAQLFAELGYALPVGETATVEPYLGVAWIKLHAKDFSESGGNAALQGKSERDDITTFTLGLRGTTTFDMGDKKALLKGGLGWRHAAGDTDPHRRVAFIQGGGTEFSVAGAPIDKNAAVVDFSAELGIGKMSALGISFSGQFSNDNTDNSASLYWKTRF